MTESRLLVGNQWRTTDALFVRDGRVVKTRAAVKPWRMSGALRAFAVIEMRSGTLAARGTLPGDILEVVAV